MNKILVFTFYAFFTLWIGNCYCQNYDQYIQKAEKEFKEKNYQSSALSYTSAFEVNNWKGYFMHRYAAAISWAMIDRKDSVYLNLNKIIDAGFYNNVNEISSEAAFKSLHKDQEWIRILDKVKLNFEKLEKIRNNPLTTKLEKIYYDDQNYRDTLANSGLSPQDPKFKELLQIIRNGDSINLVQVRKIIDENGWLGEDEVGYYGSMALFLVVQHAPLKIQEMYLPIMKQAAELKKCNPQNLAFLEDRIAMQKGQKQKYGTQVISDNKTGKFQLYPIEDIAKVDNLRKEVGLGPLRDYVKQWGIDFSGQ